MQPKQNPETHGAFDDTYIGHHESYWLASTQHTNYGPMPGDTTVDVAIIGGGIAGLTTALLLKEEGKRVAVIEADHIVEGITAYTTAKITSLHNLIYDHLERSFDAETTWLPVSFPDGTNISHTAAGSGSWAEIEYGVYYRLRCSAFTSGTVNWRISR